MKSTFRILFYGRANAANQDGTMPLTARVSINGEHVAFSIKMRVPVAIWDGKSSRAKGRSPEAIRINRYLDSISTRLTSLFHNLTEAGEIVTPQILRDEFLGVGAKNTTLLTIFDEFNERQESLIGKDITQSTFNKFDLTARRLEEFLRTKRHRDDIHIRQVDRNFVLDFEAFLKVEHGLSLNSSEKLMRIFKRITTMCFRNGMMARDPFCDVRLKKEKKDRGYLTRQELELFLNYKPENKRLERVKDRFVFCCFTGFDFSTSSSLTPKNIVQADDGSTWIETHRV